MSYSVDKIIESLRKNGCPRMAATLVDISASLGKEALGKLGIESQEQIIKICDCGQNMMVHEIEKCQQINRYKCWAVYNKSMLR